MPPKPKKLSPHVLKNAQDFAAPEDPKAFQTVNLEDLVRDGPEAHKGLFAGIPKGSPISKSLMVAMKSGLSTLYKERGDEVKRINPEFGEWLEGVAKGQIDFENHSRIQVGGALAEEEEEETRIPLRSFKASPAIIEKAKEHSHAKLRTLNEQARIDLEIDRIVQEAKTADRNFWGAVAIEYGLRMDKDHRYGFDDITNEIQVFKE